MGIATNIQKEVPGMIRSAETMMNGVAGQMQDAIGPNGENLNRGIQNGIGAVTANADALAGKLRGAQGAARETGGTGLKAIADAYEGWLTGGGLKSIMDGLTKYFQTMPASSAAAVLGPAAETAAGSEPPRPTVEIREVVVEITAAAPERAPLPALMHYLLEPERLLEPEELIGRGHVVPHLGH